MIEIRRLDPIPPNSNPFHHEHILMGTYLADNVCAMHATFSGQLPAEDRERIKNNSASYIDIVNMQTGERVRLIFGPGNFGYLNDVFDVSVLLNTGSPFTEEQELKRFYESVDTPAQ